MARLDKLKEQIGWLKVVFGILIAIDVSLLGWLANNIDGNTSMIKLIIAFILVVLVTIGVVLTNKKALEKIDEIEEL